MSIWKTAKIRRIGLTLCCAHVDKWRKDMKNDQQVFFFFLILILSKGGHATVCSFIEAPEHMRNFVINECPSLQAACSAVCSTTTTTKNLNKHVGQKV